MVLQPSLILLGDDRAKALTGIGFRNLRDLLAYQPLQSARTLAAVAQGLIAKPNLEHFVKEEFVQKDAAEAIGLPVTALHLIDSDAQALAAIGVNSIADLAQLGKEADAAVLAALEDNGFRERPSAPAQLLPGMTGSVASSVRFTTFIRDTELRNLTFKVHEDCIIPLPISSPYTKYPGSLAEIFETQKCPVLHLGYMCDHRQRWINLGTHLGEVVHSLSLAPGESRNIALVNWHRRQLTALEEQTRTRENLSATFVQNRALQEITSAVAREHQSGGTQTEANTFATAFGIVGSIGVSTAIGAAIGSTIPGVGTAIGAVAGGIAGAVAGGAVFSGSQTLGMIEADTEGNRAIVAEVQQRIALSTSQAASAVRSLWSTVVVEDTQAENVQATTSNITNYNHMHALNIEYYEVLQHYLTRIEVERIQPIIFVPFTFLDFTSFRFIRDYWEAVRPYIDDEDLQAQGDSYFVTEQEPERPDLLPVPPPPNPPGDPEPLTLTNLVIDVLFNSITFNTNVNFFLMRGNQEVQGREVENGVQASRLDGYDFGNRYIFDQIDDAQEITGVGLSRNQVAPGNMQYRIRVASGRLRSRSRQLANLQGEVIRSNATIRATDPTTANIAWSPAADFDAENALEVEEFNRKLREREIILNENLNRRAAYDALVEDRPRFELRLQKLILRRRHFFTRVLLNAIEPEEIIQLLEALRIGHTDVANADFGIPLSAIAHTIPLGMTTGAFVLKLKRLDGKKIQNLVQRLGIAENVEALKKIEEIKELATLVEYSDQTLRFFEKAKSQADLVQTDHVYAPTGGLFAEAILGRANSAEYLDMERYFNWQDSPIPHQPPAISAVSTDSRFQQGNVSVNVPEGNLQVINPVSLPDPTGLQGVLTAIQNPNLFRDMSNASTLASIIGNLSTLAGQMGQAASIMTGQAAQQALQAATEASRLATELAKSQAVQSSSPAVANSLTGIGAALNKAKEIDQQSTGAVATSGNTGNGRTSTAPSVEEAILRNVTGTEVLTSSSGGTAPLDGGSDNAGTVAVGIRIEGNSLRTVDPNETVSLTCIASPPDGTITWSSEGNPPTGTGPSFTTRFASHGTFTIEAAITANDGANARASINARVRELSGSSWTARFPGSNSTTELTSTFQASVDAFIAALRAANATVNISATYRPPERAYLMHHAWRIANDGFDPAAVPPFTGVEIAWLHRDATGNPDLAASRSASQDMVNSFSMAFIAALTSRHTQRRAIDMSISWTGTLTIADATGASVSITSSPRNGNNPDLHAIGASYGVYKLVNDPPHWSDDGH